MSHREEKKERKKVDKNPTAPQVIHDDETKKHSSKGVIGS